MVEEKGIMVEDIRIVVEVEEKKTRKKRWLS